jgi:hypothetical protein
MPVGKDHTESEQNTENGTRSPDNRRPAYQQMYDACAYAGQEVVYHKPLCTPQVFEVLPEYPQGKQVEEHMAQTAVQEHVADKLPRVKRTPLNREVHDAVLKRIKCKKFREDVKKKGIGKGQKENGVDNKQMFNSRWKYRKLRIGLIIQD